MIIIKHLKDYLKDDEFLRLAFYHIPDRGVRRKERRRYIQFTVTSGDFSLFALRRERQKLGGMFKSVLSSIIYVLFGNKSK